MANHPSILVIDADPQVRRLLRSSLSAEDYRLREATSAEDGLLQLDALKPDLVLLDFNLPDMSGVEAIRYMRWRKCECPVIVLSSRADEKDKIDALDAGADDFVAKPFGVGELSARIRVALRHAAAAFCQAAEGIFCASNLEVDFDHRRVRVDGRTVHLTPTEYGMLQFLIRNANRVVSHRQLLEEVWAGNQKKHPQYLRVYMAQLRRKLEPDPDSPRHLVTEPGIGYRFQTEACI